MSDPDINLLLNGFLDGELDAAGALAIERRLAGDAALRGELTRLQALRGALRGKLTPDRVSDQFRAKLTALASPKAAAFVRMPAQWRALAASALVAAALASAATWLAVAPDRSGDIAQAVAAGHVRGLVASQPVDVVSSDRHTVKPWFNGKLAISPPVVDLAAQGFALKGGRIDIVGGEPAPTLVYDYKKHVISLTVMPLAQAKARSSPTHQSVNGFSLVTWSDGGFSYWAVADVGFEDLENFAKAFREAAAQ